MTRLDHLTVKIAPQGSPVLGIASEASATRFAILRRSQLTSTTAHDAVINGMPVRPSVAVRYIENSLMQHLSPPPSCASHLGPDMYEFRNDLADSSWPARKLEAEHCRIKPKNVLPIGPSCLPVKHDASLSASSSQVGLIYAVFYTFWPTPSTGSAPNWSSC